jgi:GTPase
MKKIPSVVIVGRMNVGKSTLFNRIAENVRSIAFDFPGVTRDILKDQVEWKERAFEIVDTGGISFRKTEDKILEAARKKALDVLDAADLVALVVDSSIGLTDEDRDIARLIREHNKKTILVLNKWDRKTAEDHQYEFYELPHDAIVMVSAEHGININDFLDTIVSLLPERGSHVEEEPQYKVVFLGRPNVGKSSLMNALLKEERALVSEIAGTTREAISERVKFYQENIQITDTAGIRRKSAVGEHELEQLMVKSSFQALKDADIVVLLLDASQAGIVDQELKLAFYAFEEQYKALIIVINKSDLLDEAKEQAFEESFRPYEHLMSRVPLLKISCKTGKNVGKLLPLIHEVWQRYSQELPEAAVHHAFVDALRKTPLVKNMQELRVYQTRQVGTAPVTLALRVSNPDFFGPSQLKFFENIVRSNYDLNGVPVKFIIQKR